jgi:hypothetical protein
LAKVAIFTTNIDAENQILINHKCVCGALNRHFCQTRVTIRYSCSVVTGSLISIVSIPTRWVFNPIGMLLGLYSPSLATQRWPKRPAWAWFERYFRLVRCS